MTESDIIDLAYKEDLPSGDLTVETLNVHNHFGEARLIAKEDQVVSGLAVFKKCLLHIDSSFEIKDFYKDGDFVLNKQQVLHIRGNLVHLLKAERVALNFLGHLSGIATLTRCFVEQVRHTKCKILDTRKTTPLLRDLEKMAVTHGGGVNHRRDLSDKMMLKENHIALFGDISAAIHQIRNRSRDFLEVEIETLEQAKIVASLPVTRVMLDNMTNEQIDEAVRILPKSIEIEASGNMNLERVRSVAELGVDFISVGKITHSAPSGDYSLLFEWEKK